MKKSVAITTVLALHIGVISMLLVQAGCSSEPEAPAAKAKTTTEEVTTIAPAEQKEAAAADSAADLPPEGSSALRVAPTRPVANADKSDDQLPADSDIAGEPAAKPAKPAKPSEAAIVPAQTDNVYVVRKGDNLSNIAKKHRVSVSELLAINSLNRNSVIKVGQEIKIPASGEAHSAPAVKPAEATNTSVAADTETYIVKNGDSLSRIAKRHHTTVRQLMAVNNLKNHNIKVGQKLLVAKGSAAQTEALAKKPAAKVQQLEGGEVAYEIKSGDTLGVIARKHGTSVSNICKRNNISDPRKIRVGQKIVIPAKGGAVAKPAEAAKPAAQPAAPAAQAPKAPENAINVTADAPKAPEANASTPENKPVTLPAPIEGAKPVEIGTPAPAAPAASEENVPVIEL